MGKKLVRILFFVAICIFCIYTGITLYMIDSDISVHIDEGKTIYEPKQGHNYRYGPSMIINGDGSLDVWFASEGGGRAWDWIRYRNSPDGGRTWSEEQIALKPTLDGEDALSTCDPGVFKYKEYYYIGYTSTTSTNGVDNNLYIVRSKTPIGPWERWTGNGWGQEPKPVIKFTGYPSDWGIGEPSFVVKGGKIYIYYTYLGKNEDGVPVSETRLAIAPADNINWPGEVKLKGRVINRIGGQDSIDIKYIPEWKKFIGITVRNRMNPGSKIWFYQSNDGVNFKTASVNINDSTTHMHNAGITGNHLGHLELKANNYIGYAHGEKNSFWETRLHPVSFDRKVFLNPQKIMDKFIKTNNKNDSKLEKVKAKSQSGMVRSVDKAVDADPATMWSSLRHNDPYRNEWIYISSSSNTIKGLSIIPAEDLLCFPEEFVIQKTQNGVDWSDIPGQTYKNYKVADNNPVNFVFKKPVKAKAVRVLANRLTPDEVGYFYFRLAEIYEYK